MIYNQEKYKRKLQELVVTKLGMLIDKLIMIQEQFLPPESYQDRDWSIYLLNTKTHFAVVAARDGVDEVFPEDGSFINGVCLHTGMTEEEARERVTEIERRIGSSKSSSEDISSCKVGD